MKKTIGLFLLIIFGIAACVPNRLQKTLVTAEPEGNRAVPLAAPTPDGRSLQPQLDQANIDVDEVVGGRPIAATW